MDVMLSQGEVSSREEFKAFLERLDLPSIFRKDRGGRRSSSRMLLVTWGRIAT